MYKKDIHNNVSDNKYIRDGSKYIMSLNETLTSKQAFVPDMYMSQSFSLVLRNIRESYLFKFKQDFYPHSRGLWYHSAHHNQYHYCSTWVSYFKEPLIRSAHGSIILISSWMIESNDYSKFIEKNIILWYDYYLQHPGLINLSKQ